MYTRCDFVLLDDHVSQRKANVYGATTRDRYKAE